MKGSNNLPELLKRARLRRRLTQLELAVMVGVSAQAIGQFEIGKAKPRLIVYRKIIKALNVDVKSDMGFNAVSEDQLQLTRGKKRRAKANVIKLAKDVEQLKRELNELREIIDELLIK